MSIIKALAEIQNALKSPKDQNAGRYRYRNIEDINQAVKPLALAHGCAVIYTDTFTDGACISRCSLVGEEGALYAEGFACVNSTPKGMSIEQACGAASSYARKYAACGLFAIDSSENDPDRTQAKKTAAIDENLERARSQLWIAEKRYCELMGIHDVTTFHKEQIETRQDWNIDADTMSRIAQELRDAVSV